MTADRLIAGRYRLTDPIGTGAMGVVWRATDVRLRRTVAVKQLLLGPGLSRSQAVEARMRAMREGRIAARLHHPNAITVFDVAEEDGQPWLVMEYMNAPSLAARLSGKRTLPPAEVARIGAQAAGALAAAHDAGIMHRDVKPANLLVGDDGTVKITDFGISHAVGDVTVTATGFLAGTPAYLAPEVARGEKPEPASDVFALGSTLYAAVEGSPPFGEGDNPLAVLHAVARAEVPKPERAGALGPVLLRLLAPTPEERPTMREAKQALEDIAAGRNPELAPPPQTKVMPAAEADGGSDKTTVISAPEPAGATEVVAAPVATPALPPPAKSANSTLPGGNSDGGARNRVVAIGAVAALVVLIVAGVIAYAVNSGHDSGSTAASSSSVVPPVASSSGTDSSTPSPAVANPVVPEQPNPATGTPSTQPTPTPTPTPSSGAPSSGAKPPTTTPPPPITTTPFGPAVVDKSGFVSGYYGMLPGNPSGAWSQLSSSYQASTGGYNSYVAFWKEFRSVSVSGLTQNGDTVTGTVTYVHTNGFVETERRWFLVTSDGGRTVIANSQRA
ncbi:serine/threonine-protein kinase [Nocardia arthritidis]|uniref:non-specific serine/threonine protein kinase n=1 Tax=Nocardia arthritidis TaxID=228602 RepID=A0A6G9YIX7_9NOCA|nr:serine/threonine-protein kinase [Nocardia arthritidis]QIS13209.1 protein kinase [Nocardia arthritidis]